MKKSLEELNKLWTSISEKVYKENQQQNTQPGADNKENTGKNVSKADSPIPLIAAAIISMISNLFVKIICKPE